jgi:hypothetical protein
MREYQVRICERLRVKFPGPTRQKRKCPGSRGTSVLPSGADIVSLPRHVRLVPMHKVAALQPAARGQEPRDRMPAEREALAGLRAPS